MYKRIINAITLSKLQTNYCDFSFDVSWLKMVKIQVYKYILLFIILKTVAIINKNSESGL